MEKTEQVRQVIWRSDLKPVGEEEVRKALDKAPNTLYVAAAVFDKVVALRDKFGSTVPVEVDEGAHPFEILAATVETFEVPDRSAPPSAPEEVAEVVAAPRRKSKRKQAKTSTVIRAEEIHTLAQKGLSAYQISKHFQKEGVKVWYSQVKAVMEGKKEQLKVGKK